MWVTSILITHPHWLIHSLAPIPHKVQILLTTKNQSANFFLRPYPRTPSAKVSSIPWPPNHQKHTTANDRRLFHHDLDSTTLFAILNYDKSQSWLRN